MKQRNSNIELLRFILMFAICLWHLFVHGFGIKDIGNSTRINYQYLITCSILVPTVNCFMLISGYYGIKFNIKKMLNLIIQASFYFWLCTIFVFIIQKNINPQRFFHIFPIATKTWWFLTEYFTIFMITPIINKGLSSLTKQQFIFILGTLFFINSFGEYLMRASLGSNFISLLILYLTGRFLYLHKVTITRNTSIFIWTGSTIILASSVCASTLIHPQITWLLFSYNNPLIIIQAIAILYFCLSFPEKHFQPFIKLGSHCFAIYLLTEGIGFRLYSSWSKIMINHNLLITILVILTTCFFCIFLDIIQKHINDIIKSKILNISFITKYFN